MENNTSINNEPPALYHYTSFETLALILTNRTICFNSLKNVDDVEEAETADMHDFGKYVYASCWTDDPKELISLWNLYTPNMHGVRISLPVFPFKKYYYHKGEYYLTEDTSSYINLKNFYNDNRAMIVLKCPILEKVIYTNSDELISPNIRKCSSPDAVQRFLRAQTLNDAEGVKINYDLSKLGKYKREDWAFQKEWRYIIQAFPMGYRELEPPSMEKQKEFIRRMENKNTTVPYDRIFLDLDEDAVKQMKIVLGPRMSDAEKIYVKALLKEHGLEDSWQESALKIR